MTNILAIETSCDETAMAIINENREILSHIIVSQANIHKVFGGVVPEVAARNHLDIIDMVFNKTLEMASLTVDSLDAIAATTGPGLIGSVIVGTTFAKTLSSVLNKPFIAVNHLEAHALTCLLTDRVVFPFFLFLLSGGHCQILRVNGVGKYIKIGETIDDSLGETFDKVAQLIGLEYPGGPKIEEMAKAGDQYRFKFPRPLLDRRSGEQIEKMKFNFSFSGLKTAVRQEVEKIMIKNSKAGCAEEISIRDKRDISASFQKTIVEILSNRLQNVINYDRSIDTFVVAGGVAANQYIGESLKNVCTNNSCRLVVPPPKLCTDNGAMVANAALERYRCGYVNDLGVAPLARWELEGLKNYVCDKFN
ncbi:MAG: tRNA (adenosine(37)-N6)-threonylcarbamoyltransferase complex transferase subunit TsaD [Rickettsiales bacterium]|jgi:N6-L-threonylcarbamoyladenine synthase|nr:tRNA (adenosine(37)-N6)-threonylcarbamoyltransferase complex transferase subunit TsaD [Rickettsiales bacterium]